MNPGSRMKAALANKDSCLATLHSAYTELRGAVDAKVAAEDRCDSATDAYGAADLALQHAERELHAALTDAGITLNEVCAGGQDEFADELLISAA